MLAVSDVVTIFGMFFSFLSAIFGVWIGYQTLKLKSKVATVETKIVGSPATEDAPAVPGIAKNLADLEKNMNSMKDQLVEEVRARAQASGEKKGRADQQSENVARNG